MPKYNKVCSNCGNLFSSYATNNGLCANCKCSISIKKFHDIVIEKGGVLLDKYVNSRTYVSIKCNNCKEIFKMRPGHINMGGWCRCNKKTIQCVRCGTSSNGIECDVCYAGRILISIHDCYDPLLCK